MMERLKFYWENYKAMSRAYAEKAEMGNVLGDIVSLVIGVVLVASMLPTALNSLYQVNTGWFVYGGGSSGTNDTATVAIFRLLPLFAVLGGMVLIAAPIFRRLSAM